MEGNPHSSAVVPPTMFHACKPSFISNTSVESVNVDNQPDNRMGFSRRVIHGTLDLNQPISDSTLIWPDDPSQIPRPREESAVHKTGLGQLLEDTNNRGFTESEVGQNEKSVGRELTFGLSTEVGDQADQVSPQLGSASGICPDPTSKKVHADAGEPRELSLITMGCTRCWIYVMVSEIDGTCPNCNSVTLLDQFRGDPAESTRKMNGMGMKREMSMCPDECLDSRYVFEDQIRGDRCVMGMVR